MEKAIINNELRLINTFIEGSYIDNKMKLKLSENPSFMLSVLKQSNDTKFLKECAPNVIHNISFVLSVIDLFKDNLNDEFIEFLDEIISVYEKQPQLRVLCAINAMSNHREELTKYEIALEAKVQTDIVTYKRMLLDPNNEVQKPSIGFEFAYYEHCNDFEFSSDDELHGDNTVLNYYVKNFVKDALDNDMEIISYIAHNKFLSKIGFNPGELKIAIIDYVYKKDAFLGQYIYDNISTIRFLDKYIDRAKEDWISYIKRLEKEQFKAIFDEIQNYADFDTPDSPFRADDLLYLVFKDRGELGKLYNHDSAFVKPKCLFENGKVVAIIDEDDSYVRVENEDYNYIIRAAQIVERIFKARTLNEIEEYRSSIINDTSDISFDNVEPLMSGTMFGAIPINATPAKVSKIPIRVRKDDDKH